MEKLFENQETLALFLIFFIPGFISLKVYDLPIPGERRDFTKSLFDTMACTALNFAALLWLIGLLRSGGLNSWQMVCRHVFPPDRNARALACAVSGNTQTSDD